MTKKRLLKIIAITIVTAMMASGCGKTSNNGQKGEIPTLLWYEYCNSSQDVDMVFNEVSEYVKDKIGANVQCIHIPASDYKQKMSLMWASGEEYDMCFTASWLDFHSTASKSAFYGIKKLLNEDAKELMELYPNYVWKDVTLNNEIYAVPALKDFAYKYSIAYPDKLINDIKFEPETVKSLKDLTPWLAKAKEQYPKQYALGMTRDGNFGNTLGYIPLDIPCLAINIYDTSATVVVPYEQENYKEYFKLANEWFKAGYIQPDIALASSNGVSTVFSLGQHLPYQRMNENNIKKAQGKDTYSDINLYDAWMTGTSGSLIAIGRNSKHPKEAVKFLNLLNTDEKLKNMVSLGIEGKHWFAEGEKSYKLPEGLKDKNEGSYFTYGFTNGNVYLSRVPVGTPEDIYVKYQEMDKGAIQSPLMGFSVDISDLTAQIAAINDVYKQDIMPILSGSVDPDTYLPIALEKLKANGIDDLKKEVQRQIDEWKAKQ